MLLNSEEDSAVQYDSLVFLLAIAGRLDAQAKILAKKLDKDRYIYHAYAILDSLSSSYSMFKYFFEVINSSSDPDLIHKFLTSPGGIAAVSVESIFLFSFSFLGSLFDGEKEDSVKKFIATVSPYLRDFTKIKNPYKGWRNMMQVMTLLTGADLKFLVIPVGVGLSVLTAAIRLWQRYMTEKRKAQMSANRELLLEIQQLDSLTPADRDYYLSKIGYQDEKEEIQAFLAAGASGLFDGLYLYIGMIPLALLPPPVAIAMFAISAFYILACIVVRIYEEYDFQLRLKITQTECKLALVSKEIETLNASLLALQEKENKTIEDLQEIARLKMDLGILIGICIELHQLLKQQTSQTYLTAALLGLKHGLLAYGVLTSFVFTIVTVCAVSSAAFPPALLGVCILSGLVLIIGFMARALRDHYRHLQQQKQNHDGDEPYLQLLEIKENIEAENETEGLLGDNLSLALKNATSLNPAPKSLFPEWSEVFRSAASGWSKGNNVWRWMTTPLQVLDSHGQHHDTPAMSALTMASSLLYAIVMGLRALAKLGRPGPGQAKPADVEMTVTNASADQIKTEPPRESSGFFKKRSPDSLPRNESFLTNLSIFSKKSPSPVSQKLLRSKSENDIEMYDRKLNHCTILGLE